MKEHIKSIFVCWFAIILCFLLSFEIRGQTPSKNPDFFYRESDFLWSVNVNERVNGTFTPTGEFVFIHDGFDEDGDLKGKITFLKAVTGEVASTFLPCNGAEFGTFIYRRQWASFNKNGDLIAISCFKKGVELWNIKLGKLLGSFRSWGDEPGISPDGTRLVTTNVLSDNPPELWNTENQQKIALLTGEQMFGWRAPLAVDYGPDGNLLAIAYYTEVYLWDARDGKLMVRLEDDETGPNGKPSNQSPEFRIYDLAFTSDGKTLITGTARSVKFWDVASGKLKFKIAAGHKPVMNDLAISPDESLLATAAKDKSIKLWDMKTGNLVRTLVKPKETAQEISFSPDGKKLLYRGAFDSQRAIIYDVETGKILWQSKHGTVETVLSPQWDMVLVKDFKLNVIKAYKTKFTFGK